MTLPLHTNNLILLPYMAKTNVWRSRTAAGILMSLPIWQKTGYMRVYVMQRKGGLRSAFDGIDEDILIVSSRLVHSKTQ